MTECTCQNPPFYYLDYDKIDLGWDPRYGEVSIQTCKTCGTKWAEYLIEEEHYSRAGRWWRAQISNEDSLALTAGNAKEYVERQEWCFVGGSFYEVGIHKIMKPIKVL